MVLPFRDWGGRECSEAQKRQRRCLIPGLVDRCEFLMALELELGVEIPEGATAGLDTVAALVNCLHGFLATTPLGDGTASPEPTPNR